MLGFRQPFSGDIVDVINNPLKIYEGDLRHYARIIFAAPNIHHGYHGLRHMLHVTWVCYEACAYYERREMMTPRSMRNLLIAAMFHDYGHIGKKGEDAENIKVAIAAMHHSLLPEDLTESDVIEEIIKATQFPHNDLGDFITLEQSIIRDADVSQAFGTAWIGEIAAGFGSELNKTPVEMLRLQLSFLGTVHFNSDFGKVFYGKDAVAAKIQETEDLLKILSV